SPRPSAGGDRGAWTSARSSTPSATCSAAAAPGVCCPTTSPPGPRSTPTSGAGACRGPGNGCTPACARRCASRPAGQPRPGPPPRSAEAPSPPVGAATAATTRGKKIGGRKRHVLVDTLGLLLAALVPPASIQDRDGARAVLLQARGRFPRLRLIWADG